MAGSQHKDAGIQSLRGVAVLLMVAGHVIAGLRVDPGSGWWFSYRALEDLRMPLFATLSGFVYAYRPVRAPEGMHRLYRGKVRRLLVPFFVVGTAFFLIETIAPDVNTRPRLSELPESYIYGYAHFWFLQAIFLIFMMVGSLDAFGVLRSFPRWAAVTVSSFALFVLVRVPEAANVFSVNEAFRLLPFFLLGYGAHRHAQQLLRRRALVVACCAFVPVYVLRLWEIASGRVWQPVPERAVSLAVAVLLVVPLLGIRHRLAARALVTVGGFSFGVYLLHAFGSAGARIAFRGLGLENVPVHFLLGMLFGVGLPILFELVFGRFPAVSWGVLGQEPRRRPSSSIATYTG